MRRLFFAGVVLASAVFWSGSAAAISVTFSQTDPISATRAYATVTLDTEATTGITLFSVGVLFDDTRLIYRQDLSSTTSYILYGGNAKGGGDYLNAASTCGGGYGSPTAGDGCSLALPGQVNIDFVSTDLTNGTGAQNTGTVLLATLVFDRTGGYCNLCSASLSQTAPGNVIGQPGGTSTTATLYGGGLIFTPEPSTALLLGIGLAGLAARKRV